MTKLTMSWTVKKAECQRIDAFELWCWRRLLRVPLTERRSNQSILKKISPEYSLEGLMLMLKCQYFGCLNFFAGPTDSKFKAPFNWYNVHYLYTHVVGTSGGNTNDMQEAIQMMNEGKLNPSALVTHIGGLNAVVDTVLNLPSIPGGKKLIYNHIDLPLAAIADFEELGKTDPMFAELDRLCKANNNLWNPEAEKYLLANAKKI